MVIEVLTRKVCNTFAEKLPVPIIPTLTIFLPICECEIRSNFLSDKNNDICCVPKSKHLLKDTYKLQGQRSQLVRELKKLGISSTKVLKAIQAVPRHFFFPIDFLDKAYENIAFPIDGGQTISQPYTVAKQTELLDIQQGDKVLEIGTGSGYQSAVLKVLGARVYSIETVKPLHDQATELFKKLGLDIASIYGDGSQGLPELAPFDKIIMTAAAPKLKSSLTEQLTLNGRLVAPVGNLAVQKMILVTRNDDNQYTETTHGDFKFVPLTGTHGWSN
jgi:protein-L-isoaspartate(D-aspartate) O-methyltransferase